MNAAEVEKAVGYEFSDKNLLARALTLPSASLKNNNQTLEFFGDAILEFIVSEKLYSAYPDDDEGMLTERRKSVVSDEALAPVSLRLGLAENLIRTAGDSNNKKAVPSAYEAMVAAIYLDGGMEEARKFVYGTLDFTVGVNSSDNYKGELQEILQGMGLPLPVYECTDEGTAQNPSFRVTVAVCGASFSATAEKKSKAERLAAKQAIDYIGKR